MSAMRRAFDGARLLREVQAQSHGQEHRKLAARDRVVRAERRRSTARREAGRDHRLDEAEERLVVGTSLGKVAMAGPGDTVSAHWMRHPRSLVSPEISAAR